MNAPHRPDVLYHYTSAAGLLGIAETRVLWATDAEFMNDAQELQFGRAELHAALLRAADLLSQAGSEGGLEDSRATVMRSAADHLEPGGLFAQKQWHAVYVACFCESGDLLSQWRGYGSSGGFAIGFRTSALESMQPPAAKVGVIEVAGEVLDPVRLVKVSYGVGAVEPVVRHVVENIAPEPVGHPGVQGFYRAKVLVLPALATIKHAAFSEEREWRLIVVASLGEAALRFRAASLGIVPYVQLPLDAGSIAEVVVGPGHHPELRRRGVERLLADNGFDEVAVRVSDAPFRG